MTSPYSLNHVTISSKSAEIQPAPPPLKGQDQPSSETPVRPLEQELIHALQMIGEGQWQAWSRVVGIVGPRALRYARFLTEHDADAEDVVQQALTRLAQQPSLMRVVQHPWAYFLKIVRNEATRFRLKHQRPGTFSVEFCADLRISSSVVIDPLEVAERRQIIQSALKELPADQAEVVILKFWEGMTFQEMAAVVGENPNTVASRYRYAITKLARLLRSLEGEAIHVS